MKIMSTFGNKSYYEKMRAITDCTKNYWCIIVSISSNMFSVDEYFEYAEQNGASSEMVNAANNSDRCSP